jgi:hypothetical protein
MASATVLVVEDDDSIRRLVSGALEADGYAVLEAPGADEALEACRRHPGPIDLVLSDVMMPRVRGDQLVPQLLARRPEMRALYMSGFLADVPAARIRPLLEKPFTLADLRAAVRDTLAAPRAA